jgi:hypothetical protein
MSNQKFYIAAINNGKLIFKTELMNLDLAIKMAEQLTKIYCENDDLFDVVEVYGEDDELFSSEKAW